MLAYNLLFLCMVILGLLLCEWKPGKRNTIIYLAITSAALVVMASLRAKTVGIDYYQYEVYFADVCKGGFPFLLSDANMYRAEFGYGVLNWLVSLFTDNIYVFMAVVAFLIVGMTAVVLYRDCSVPWVGMLVFVAFNFYGNSLAFIRQSFALAIFLFAIRYLRQKRFVPYLLIVLLALTFHKSMLLMIPVYFIAQLALNWKSIAAYVSATVFVMIFSWPLFYFITQFIYQNYATEEGLYFMNGRDWNTAFIPVIVTIAAFCMKKLLLEKDAQNLPLLNFSIYSGLLFIMTCQHFLFQRIANIFFTTCIFLIPEMLVSLRTNGGKLQVAEGIAALQKKKGVGTEERRRAMRERRQEKSMANWHRYYYYYALAAVIFFGLMYFIWFLNANRINLIPYLTFMQLPNPPRV